MGACLEWAVGRGGAAQGKCCASDTFMAPPPTPSPIGCGENRLPYKAIVDFVVDPSTMTVTMREEDLERLRSGDAAVASAMTRLRDVRQVRRSARLKGKRQNYRDLRLEIMNRNEQVTRSKKFSCIHYEQY